ncbi:hypothetical protein BJ878DRAFT_415389 [Calycina marina]|uniref:Copper-fist domain-containing protein n=1 Tax=Calycina marina TaxID=1763456 RepID=A0A9P7Z8G0_9HELO|nr:hypothetical protein BJ878DRAFT_415389 [Calycina marina]
MLIKGEKYACEACVRGHRVSNCQHSDRQLQHINKKGRPVSQCSHCRTLRKSRSAHVRCECGEKAHAKGACTHEENVSAETCCCSHGGRCTCSLKKEQLDPVPESDSDEPVPITKATVDVRRPRASTEGGLTIFTNGHHKPGHRHNTMAHKCGLPYVVPRTHPTHGASPAGLANRSVDNLPHVNTIDALHSESQIKDSIMSAQQEQRLVRSEHGSPHVAPASTLDQLNGQLPRLDSLTYPASYDCLQSMDQFVGTYYPGDAQPPTEQDVPVFSAGLNAPSINWLDYDGLDFNNDGLAASSYSQAASYTGFDFGSLEQPALTMTSTSDEISEVEDFPSFDTSAIRPRLVNNQYGSDFDTSDLEDMATYRLSTASSYVNLPQAQAATNLDIDSFLNTSDGYTATTNYGLPTYNEPKNVQTDMNNFDNADNFLGFITEEDSGVFWMSVNDSSTSLNQPQGSEIAGEHGSWVQ